MVANLKVLMQAVVEYSHSKPAWGELAAKDFRDEVRVALDTPSTGLPPQRLMEVARAVLPRDTVATCDAGASRLLVVQKWESYGPREFLTSNGLGSMGFAIPGALAAKLAFPDRPVVAFTGDGGAMMAIAEIQTAVKENLPIIVVVIDDQEIGLIRVKQELKGIARHGISVGGIDWEALAHGMGAEGTTVSTENGLQDALKVALKSKRTTIIGARIDPSGYVAQFNALREL
jgi:acetolactate synthase-1/2/3 large subunit